MFKKNALICQGSNSKTFMSHVSFEEVRGFEVPHIFSVEESREKNEKISTTNSLK